MKGIIAGIAFWYYSEVNSVLTDFVLQFYFGALLERMFGIMTSKFDDLIRDLSDADFEKRPHGQVAFATKTAFQAKDQLIAMGKEAVPAVIVCLMSQSPAHQRAMAAQVLGEVGGTDAVNALINMLRDPEMLVRGFSAEALGKIGDKRAVAPLREMANRQGEVSEVIAYAKGALNRFGETAALPKSRMEKGTLWKAVYWIGILMVIFSCLTIGLTLFSMSDSSVVAIDWPAIIGCTGPAVVLGGLLAYIASRPEKPIQSNESEDK
ncbi:MAG: HEAT repeat domain-containing protein [Anaerolineales bacterium]|nr:HEAT repeat domain-containing protein [Anaerolineales bacterium]